MKNKTCYFLLISSTVLNLACNSNLTEATAEKNIDRAKKSFQAFNEHNWELKASYFSDSCKYLDLPMEINILL